MSRDRRHESCDRRDFGSELLVFKMVPVHSVVAALLLTCFVLPLYSEPEPEPQGKHLNDDDDKKDLKLKCSKCWNTVQFKDCI